MEHELVPGVSLPVFAFNKQVPGPLFRVQENDWVKVNVTNNTEEMHTIHWHGLDVIYTMDGVPMVTQDPIHPGETFCLPLSGTPGRHAFLPLPLEHAAAHDVGPARCVHHRSSR